MSERSGPEAFASIPPVSAFSGNARNYHDGRDASLRAYCFRNAFMA
ncbi:hypothetical protein [Burkholderia ambifaria]|nr:hypothetical protein [Burkholderia ambifaria]